MNTALKTISIQIWIFIWLFIALWVVYAAWDDVVSSWDPLSATSWNDIVSRVKVIDNENNIVTIHSDRDMSSWKLCGVTLWTNDVSGAPTTRLNIRRDDMIVYLPLKLQWNTVFWGTTSGFDLVLDSNSSDTKTNIIIWPSGGKVWIWTSDPIDTLQVESSTTTVLGVNTTGTDSTSRAILAFDRAGAQRWDIGVNTNNWNNNNLYIRKNGSPSEYIATFLENWNVWIHQLLPQATLDVWGSIKLWDDWEACDSVSEWSIRYNGSVHQWCNGVTWNDLY